MTACLRKTCCNYAWFACIDHSDYQNRIGLKTACENPNRFWSWTKIPWNWKIQTNQRLRCDIRVKKSTDYVRATSAAAVAAAAAAAAAVAALPLLLSVYDLCSTAAMRRLSVDATGARCSLCAWGVLFDVRVLPQSPEHDDYQVLQMAAKKHSTQSTRVSILQ